MLIPTLALAIFLSAGQPGDRPQDGPDGRPADRQRGPGGFGPMMGDRKILHQYDKDGDGKLNAAERKAAREDMKKNGGNRRGPGGGRPGGPGGAGGPGGPGGPGGMGGDEKPSPGEKVAKSDVKPLEGGAFDEKVLRTIFLDFEGSDWEDELGDFSKSDVEVPASMTVDGKTFKDVGVSFRGMSSLMMVGKGSKRSLNISADYGDPKRRILGQKTFNLLNAHEDATFMHTALSLHIAAALKIPAPRNFARVIINGENWGIYTNAEQFGKSMLADRFPGTGGEGARWKVPGNPGARGGLEYLGDDVSEYKKHYEIKTKDDAKSWDAFIDLCRTLNETPADQLEEALKPKLDIDGALWFLALDDALSNGDGYWVRCSDYNIYRDPKGLFHVIPHDMNETFSAGGGPGGPGGGRRGPRGGGGGPPQGAAGLEVQDGLASIQPGGQPGGPPDDDRPRRPDFDGGPDGPGGPGGPGGGPGGPGGRRGGPMGGGGVKLDPLVGLDDDSKPLRSKLLKVPSLRAKYLAHIRTIAREWLDWQKLGPVVADYRSLIDAGLKADTKKLSSYEAFQKATSPEAGTATGREMSLRQFAEQHRAYLLGLDAIKNLPEDAR